MIQYIIIRKDLKMSPGKLAVQVAHASVRAFLKCNESDQKEWLDSHYKKIVLYVKSEKKLLKLYEELSFLPIVLITDLGLTEFDELTDTAVGVGPIENIPKALMKLQTLKGVINYD